MGLQSYLILAAVVFGIGMFGVVTRRNTIGILLGIELMMNAVNINLVAFALFTICITVAEAAMGLAIVILLFRIRRSVMADHLDLLKG
jgi:NADH-quinone oxidoreductase subunit K